jgi:hypothetical protein
LRGFSLRRNGVRGVLLALGLLGNILAQFATLAKQSAVNYLKSLFVFRLSQRSPSGIAMYVEMIRN